ncbi:unnamed protein product [Hapterophycus canaliculatus]
MNAARAGRNVAGLAVRRAGVSTPGQAVQRQVANKTTSASKGKGVVGAPPKAKADAPPKVSQETLNPPPSAPKAPPVSHETLTPPLAKGGAAASGGAAVPPKTKSNNLLIGAVLVGAAAASYYVTIHKMKDQDFLGDAEKEAMEEAQVNLHKSGLKVSNKVVPDKVEKVYNKASEGISDAMSKAGGTVRYVSASAKSKASDTATSVKSEVSDAVEEVKSEASEAAADVKAEVSGEAEKTKKKGWRKYIIFGPRREV